LLCAYFPPVVVLVLYNLARAAKVARDRPPTDPARYHKLCRWVAVAGWLIVAAHIGMALLWISWR